MINVEALEKSYGSLKVLNGVDLKITKGKIVSIIGKSGAGKSTLLHIMGTLDVPDKGTLRIEGQTLNALKEKDLAIFRNKKIGFIFQFHHLLDEFTALDNVCIPALIQGLNKKVAEEKALKLLTLLGLKDRADHKPSQLSGGEQQRVAVARALINEPAVVFADEPTGNLDNANSKDLHDLFVQLRDQLGQTFVIVTHNNELARLSDEVFLMVDGKISKLNKEEQEALL